jgi:hypothetical protein
MNDSSTIFRTTFTTSEPCFRKQSFAFTSNMLNLLAIEDLLPLRFTPAAPNKRSEATLDAGTWSATLEVCARFGNEISFAPQIKAKCDVSGASLIFAVTTATSSGYGIPGRIPRGIILEYFAQECIS